MRAGAEAARCHDADVKLLLFAARACKSVDIQSRLNLYKTPTDSINNLCLKIDLYTTDLTYVYIELRQVCYILVIPESIIDEV